MSTLPMFGNGTWYNTWDGENRLVEMYNDTVGKKLEFVYDYMGRRVEKKVYTGTSGTSWTLSSHERFMYNGYKLVQKMDGLDSNALLQTFHWLYDDLVAIEGDYSAIGGPKSYYCFSDANKNIVQVYDNIQNCVAKYEYSPFGVQTLATGTYATSNPFRFSSEYYDDETGLVYYNFRYYSPDLGRWLSRDPIEEEGGYNLYGFIENNPVDYCDELGLSVYVPPPPEDMRKRQEESLRELREMLRKSLLEKTRKKYRKTCDRYKNKKCSKCSSRYNKCTSAANKAAEEFVNSIYPKLPSPPKATPDLTQPQAQILVLPFLPGKAPNRITGYTRHGLNQAISRDGGRGVSIKAINDAVKNPQKVVTQSGGRVKYVGKNATVVLNKDGKVITTYGQPRRK